MQPNETVIALVGITLGLVLEWDKGSARAGVVHSQIQDGR